MKTKLASFMLGLLLSYSVSTRAENFSAEELNRHAIERRAIEAVIWGMAAVNYDLMYQAMVRYAKAGEDSHKIVYCSRSLRPKKNVTANRSTDSPTCRPSIRRLEL